MALSQSALSELLDAIRAGGSADVLREAMTLVLQELIELEAAQAIGAGRYERTDDRTTHRNGSRSRLLSTKAGDVELRIPKLRTGSFFPALLEPRRRIDRALWAVVMEAYVHGVSTRKVDDLVAALGIDAGISKSEVSRICGELDAVVAEFRDRPLGHTAFPYVFLDATYVKAHDGARVVQGDRRRHRGDPDRRPRGPGPGRRRQRGRRLLDGLPALASGRAAWPACGWSSATPTRASRRRSAAVLLGAAWQRCRVHFLRNVLARIPKGSAEMVLAAIRTIFAQPDAAAVGEQLDEIVERLEPRFPVVAAMLAEAKADITAFTGFPVSHWKKIWSTNPLERVNKEIKRRTDVVGIFPNEAAVMRLAGAVLLEIHDEWAIAERRYLSEGSMARLDPARDDEPTKEVERAKTVLLAS